MNEVASVCKQNHLRLQVQALSSKAQSTQERGGWGIDGKGIWGLGKTPTTFHIRT